MIQDDTVDTRKITAPCFLPCLMTALTMEEKERQFGIGSLYPILYCTVAIWDWFHHCYLCGMWVFLCFIIYTISKIVSCTVIYTVLFSALFKELYTVVLPVMPTVLYCTVCCTVLCTVHYTVYYNVHYPVPITTNNTVQCRLLLMK